jgi:sarcosine oxidase
MFYGFPAIDGPGGGLKIAGEQFDQVIQPDEKRTEVSREEMAAMFTVAAPHLNISAQCVRTVACRAFDDEELNPAGSRGTLLHRQ